MRVYVNHDSKGTELGAHFDYKVERLMADGAVRIDAPTGFQENLVCVIHNDIFGGALYLGTEEALSDYLENIKDSDHRLRQWLIYPHAKAVVMEYP